MRSRCAVCLLTDERVHAVVLESRGRQRQVTGHGSTPLRLPDSLLADHDVDELAESVSDALAQAGGNGQPVTLVVPLHWSFTHQLSGVSRRATPQALSFAFEEYLPLPLEEVTCAFLQEAGDRVLAVAVPTSPMLRLIGALATRHITVEHVTVDAVAALVGNGSATSCGTIVLDERWARVALLGDRSSQATTGIFGLSGHDNTAVALSGEFAQRGWTNGDVPPSWQVYDLGDGDATIEDALPTDSEVIRHLKGEPAIHALAVAAATASTLDLRTGALAGKGRFAEVVRLAQHCLVCVLVLVVVLTGGMHLHKRALDQQLADMDTARRAIYREAFDTKVVPPGAAMRLASERLRLEGLTRMSARDGSAPADDVLKPLCVLREIVARLPEDVRVMLLDTRIDENQLTLRGQTATHRDAERIVEAINEVPGIHARPPRTTRLRTGGVEFSIIATRD